MIPHRLCQRLAIDESRLCQRLAMDESRLCLICSIYFLHRSQIKIVEKYPDKIDWNFIQNSSEDYRSSPEFLRIAMSSYEESTILQVYEIFGGIKLILYPLLLLLLLFTKNDIKKLDTL